MKKYLVIAALFGALAVILGAFGAHVLKDSLSESQMSSFQTAIKYQMFHVLAVLLINNINSLTNNIKQYLSLFFLIGIVFFSGSIYAITFGVSAKLIWFITPLGGLLFILGWLTLAYYFIKKI